MDDTEWRSMWFKQLTIHEEKMVPEDEVRKVLESYGLPHEYVLSGTGLDLRMLPPVSFLRPGAGKVERVRAVPYYIRTDELPGFESHGLYEIYDAFWEKMYNAGQILGRRWNMPLTCEILFSWEQGTDDISRALGLAGPWHTNSKLVGRKMPDRPLTIPEDKNPVFVRE
ncbi:MAG: hypothetical protein ABIA93_00035 [Candidatus Woesearchaeota archaeon]